MYFFQQFFLYIHVNSKKHKQMHTHPHTYIYKHIQPHIHTHIYIYTYIQFKLHINKQISYNLHIYNDLIDPDVNFI
jgi:hypothetical protein